jgi:hypothetical protein
MKLHGVYLGATDAGGRFHVMICCQSMKDVLGPNGREIEILIAPFWTASSARRPSMVTASPNRCRTGSRGRCRADFDYRCPATKPAQWRSGEH